MTDLPSTSTLPEPRNACDAMRPRVRAELRPARTSGRSALHLERVFEFVPSLSYGDPSQNALIHGENLHVLQSLQETLAGRVKCVYIDPPYNNQERYRHYNDVSSHDEWLRMI